MHERRVDPVAEVDEKWQPARLFPITGIGGQPEQERRGCSAFLAVLQSVREFGRALTMRCGAPAGTIETFIEVPFTLGEIKFRPDGLIRVSRGQKSWTALVEVPAERVTEEIRKKLPEDDGVEVIVTPLTRADTEQSQRGSNPCSHLERVGSYVQWMQVSTIAPGQEGNLVQPVHSIRPSTAKRMDNWMDNFAVPDVLDGRGMGHLEQPPDLWGWITSHRMVSLGDGATLTLRSSCHHVVARVTSSSETPAVVARSDIEPSDM